MCSNKDSDFIFDKVGDSNFILDKVGFSEFIVDKELLIIVEIAITTPYIYLLYFVGGQNI